MKVFTALLFAFAVIAQDTTEVVDEPVDSTTTEAVVLEDVAEGFFDEPVESTTTKAAAEGFNFRFF
jgi:hypothetical protein